MEPVEGAPLIQHVTTDDAAARSSSRSSSRHRAALALVLVSVSALFVAARQTSSAADAEERLATAERDGSGGTDDYTDENGLYVCKNGVPEVPNEYSNGSWGNIDGRWCALVSASDL